MKELLLLLGLAGIGYLGYSEYKRSEKDDDDEVPPRMPGVDDEGNISLKDIDPNTVLRQFPSINEYAKNLAGMHVRASGACADCGGRHE